MLNRIVIGGRLTGDPELRRTQNGTSVVSFTVACDRDYSGQDGSLPTDFIDCVAWRGTAEFISRNFSKGQSIMVDGRLEFENYTDKNGIKRRVAKVNAGNVYFCGSKPQPAEIQEQQFAEIADDDLTDGPLPL